ILFHKRMRKVAQMTSGGGLMKEQKIKQAEKQLLCLNIYQACMTLVNQIPHVTWQFLLFLLPPSYEYCEGKFVGPICDGALMLTDIIDLFVLIAVNREVRQSLVNTMPCLAICCKAKVAPENTINGQSGRQGGKSETSDSD